MWTQDINDIKYIPAFMTNRPMGVDWEFPSGIGGVLNLVDNRGTGLTPKVLLKDIPYDIYNDLIHIPLDFYENDFKLFLENLT